MSTFLLVVACVLTLLFVPLVHAIENSGTEAGMASIGIPMLQVLRAGALIAGLLATGRMGIAASIAGVLAMEATCTAMHFLSMDYEMQRWAQRLFAFLGTCFPALVLAAGFLQARPLYLVAVGLSMLTGAGVWAGYDRLAEPYRTERARQLRDEEEKSERRRAELAELPADAGVARLLPFIAAAEPPATSGAAAGRIWAQEDAVEQLVAELGTPRRLLALYALRPEMGKLTTAQVEPCWRAIGELAGAERPSWAEVEMLYKATLAMTEKRQDWRDGHRAEAEAVRTAVRRAERVGTYRLGTAWLDAQLDRR